MGRAASDLALIQQICGGAQYIEGLFWQSRVRVHDKLPGNLLKAFEPTVLRLIGPFLF
jgi:hypothetical protein